MLFAGSGSCFTGRTAAAIAMTEREPSPIAPR
jgi:hypothetical protein